MERVVAHLHVAQVSVSNLSPQTVSQTEVNGDIPQTLQKMSEEYLKLIHDHFLPPSL